MLLFGIEPQFDFADTTRALKALLGAKVVACSAFVSEQLKELADVILPIGLLPEMQATLTNLNGVEQATEAAGKLPGSAQSGWRVLRALYEECRLPAMAFHRHRPAARTESSSVPVTSGTGLAVDGTQRRTASNASAARRFTGSMRLPVARTPCRRIR